MYIELSAVIKLLLIISSYAWVASFEAQGHRDFLK